MYLYQCLLGGFWLFCTVNISWNSALSQAPPVWGRAGQTAWEAGGFTGGADCVQTKVRVTAGAGGAATPPSYSNSQKHRRPEENISHIGSEETETGGECKQKTMKICATLIWVCAVMCIYLLTVSPEEAAGQILDSSTNTESLEEKEQQNSMVFDLEELFHESDDSFWYNEICTKNKYTIIYLCYMYFIMWSLKLNFPEQLLQWDKVGLQGGRHWASADPGADWGAGKCGWWRGNEGWRGGAGLGSGIRSLLQQCICLRSLLRHYLNSGLSWFFSSYWYFSWMFNIHITPDLSTMYDMILNPDWRKVSLLMTFSFCLLSHRFLVTAAVPQMLLTMNLKFVKWLEPSPPRKNLTLVVRKQSVLLTAAIII